MTDREQLESAGSPVVSGPADVSVQPLDTSAPGPETPAAAEPEAPRERAAGSSAPHTHSQAQAHARESLRENGGVSFWGRTVARFEETADGAAIIQFEVPSNIAQKLKGLWPSLLDVRLDGEFSGQKAAVTLRTPVGPPTRWERKLERRAARGTPK
jgi:hypothetical protein